MTFRQTLTTAILAIVCSWLSSAGSPHAMAAEGYFDSSGTRIRFTDEGAGPPVVLIHGFTASADLNWLIPGTTNMLAKRYRVIALDNRGHGKSDRPEEVAAYGAKMAGDVIHLLDHLKIDRAHLVGYSMGGMITLKLAATNPQRLRSALIGGMGWVEEGPSAPESDREDIRGNAALRACLRGFPQLGITREQLKEIRTPLEVVIGDKDGLLERRVAPLLEVRPDIPVVKIAGANHLTCIFRPEFRQAILDFLDRQPKPAAADSEGP